MHTIKPNINRQKFADYVNASRFDAQISIAIEIRKRIPYFDNDDIGGSCAELFIQIINNIVDGHETSNPVITAVPSSNPKIKEVPTTTVYFDDSDAEYRRLISVLKRVTDSSTTSIVDKFQNFIGSKKERRLSSANKRWNNPLGNWK